jgi:ribonuclease T
LKKNLGKKMTETLANHLIQQRFRGYYPVVIDVETGGLDANVDALLELAVITLDCTVSGKFILGEKKHYHIIPFANANISAESLKITGIDPYHPFRFAVTEATALKNTFQFLKAKQKAANCNRCVLVGHNAWFDLSFLNAAVKRTELKKNPFHPFTSFDTASLAGLIYGQTVLAQAAKIANIPFAQEESHSALYDAEKTAELFCKMVNLWPWQFVLPETTPI